MGTKSWERSYSLTERNILNADHCLTCKIIKFLSWCGSKFFILNINSCRTCKKIAMNSRSYKNTFTVFARELEDRVIYMITNFLVHKLVIALTGSDMNLLIRYHIMEKICIHTCSIYDKSCSYLSVISTKAIATVYFLYILNFSIEAEFYAVITSILCKSYSKIKRAHNSTGSCQ